MGSRRSSYVSECRVGHESTKLRIHTQFTAVSRSSFLRVINCIKFVSEHRGTFPRVYLAGQGSLIIHSGVFSDFQGWRTGMAESSVTAAIWKDLNWGGTSFFKEFQKP